MRSSDLFSRMNVTADMESKPCSTNAIATITGALKNNDKRQSDIDKPRNKDQNNCSSVYLPRPATQ